jgi:hypothetical protein
MSRRPYVDAKIASCPDQPNHSAYTRDGASRFLNQSTIGSSDTNSPHLPTDVDALKELVPGYKLRLMPGLGHFVQLEDPAPFNALLEETPADFAAEDP